MTARVVDTNVILVANDAHAEASPECVIACVNALTDIMQRGRLILDDQYRILQEYQNKTIPVKGKGVGDVFVKWALRNLRTPSKVETVTLSEIAHSTFMEFPSADLQDVFDPGDRKFAAVSHAHHERPQILQAVDCKWIDWWPALSIFGVVVVFLCCDDVCRFYELKFPGRPSPTLP